MKHVHTHLLGLNLGLKHRKASSSPQHGLGLIEVMLIIVLLGSLLLAGFLQWRTRSAEEATKQEQTQLAQAETALISYASVNYRLPCPAALPGGVEDCTIPVQKGWFPAQTLIVSGIDPGVSVKQLRYIVQRGSSDFDLASAASDAWRPVEYGSSGLAMRDTGYSSAPILTLSDFCTRLRQGASQAYNAGYASVASTPGRLVAFALAHPGLEDKDGDGNLFDGANANGTPIFEPANRGFSFSGYDDIVSERSFNSLSAAFNCDLLNNSIDSVALAHDLVTVVRGMRDDNIRSAGFAVAWAAASAIMAGLASVETGIGIASDTGNAAVDAGICAASLGLAVNACAALGVHGTATALGGGVIALNVASIAGSLVAIAVAGVANVKALASGSDAATISTSTSTVDCLPPGNTATASLDAQNAVVIESINAQITTTTNDRITTQNLLSVAQNSLTLAITAKNNAINALYAAARYNQASSTIDGAVGAVIDDAGALLPLQTAYIASVAKVSATQAELNNATANLAKYQNMLDNRAALTTLTQNSLTLATATLANLTNSNAPTPTIANAYDEVNRLKADLAVLENQGPPTGATPTLTDLRDSALADKASATLALSAAQADLTTANNNRAGAASTYTNAYDSLLLQSAGVYTITYPSPATPSFVLSCTTGIVGGPTVCGTTTVPTYYDVSAKLVALVGSGADNGRLAPAEDSLFAAPEKIQRLINGLNDVIAKYTQTITDLQAKRTELNKPTATLPTCTTATRNNSPFSPNFALRILEAVDQKGGSR